MRYFFGSFPGTDDVLLIESGSPAVSRRVLERVRAHFPVARYHLLTCWPEPTAAAGPGVATARSLCRGLVPVHSPAPSNAEENKAEKPVPEGNKAEGPETTPEHRSAPYQSVFRASDYPAGLDKIRLLSSLARRRWRVLVILCTGEPFLWRWKLLALAIFPSKVLIANENADFFWLDWAHRRNLRQFLGVRWGVNLDQIAATVLRALVFPFTLLFLLLTALYLYTRRWRRLLLWKLRPASDRSAAAASLPKARSS